LKEGVGCLDRLFEASVALSDLADYSPINHANAILRSKAVEEAPRMKPHITNKEADAEFNAIHEALKRAAIRARELAFQTRTLLVYVKDGKLISKVPTKRG
jgi:hypothetical protein